MIGLGIAKPVSTAVRITVVASVVMAPSIEDLEPIIEFASEELPKLEEAREAVVTYLANGLAKDANIAGEAKDFVETSAEAGAELMAEAFEGAEATVTNAEVAKPAIDAFSRAARAAQVSTRVANSANHVFGNKLDEHQLGGVLETFGGDRVKAFLALEGHVQQLANSGKIGGVYKVVTEFVGEIITVHGRVLNDGTVRVGTAFVAR